ncbi:MAG: hypothetical protein QM692_15760 [Thermomicrobiales bacterium]
MTDRFVIEPLAAGVDRSGFRCGNDRIDTYFRQTVTQDIKRGYAACRVAVEETTQQLAGFYTLSSSSVPLSEVPADLTRRLPRYPTVPAVLIGWLGRDERFSRAGVGELLLIDAIRTVADAPIGVHAIFADAIDDRAAAFYASFQFVQLQARPTTWYIQLSTAVRSLGI